MSIIDVVPLVEAQFEDAARVLACALHDDPLFSYVLPNPEERALRLPAFFEINLRYGHLFGEVFTTAGTPEGAAVWLPPGSEITPERAVSAGFNRLTTILGEDAVQRLGRLLDYLEEQHHRDLPPEHWYLMVVGVAPDRQRQGIGRALLQPGLNRADAAGAPCCLDTALPQNVPIYQSLGFRIQMETVEPESGLPLWTFRRDPP